MSSAISTQSLYASYGPKVALRDLTMDIPLGASLAVIGPNGSGKSTLLGVLAGTLEPQSGTSTVTGPPPSFVMQSTTVDPSLPITVRDTVSMGRYSSLGLFGRFQPADRQAVQDAMERVAIDDLESRQLHELSGGQRQRVFVAQGLAQETDVVLLDEPVTGLDVTSHSIILDLIDEEVALGRTIVVTTHSLDEARRCDNVLILNTSAIALGTPDEVLTENNLREAFGGNFVRIGDKFILDDPHHHHHH